MVWSETLLRNFWIAQNLIDGFIWYFEIQLRIHLVLYKRSFNNIEQNWNMFIPPGCVFSMFQTYRMLLLASLLVAKNRMRLSNIWTLDYLILCAMRYSFASKLSKGIALLTTTHRYPRVNSTSIGESRCVEPEPSRSDAMQL